MLRSPVPLVSAVTNMVHVHGVRQYIPATGPNVAAGGSGGFTLTVNGQAGATWPPVRVNAVMGTVRRGSPAGCCEARRTRARALTLRRRQNVTVVLSGPSPFVGAVLTSYQFTNRAGGNLFTSTGAATAYNCAQQTGPLSTVTPGTLTVRRAKEYCAVGALTRRCAWRR